MIDVKLPNGETITVNTDDPQAASQAAKKFWDNRPGMLERGWGFAKEVVTGDRRLEQMPEELRGKSEFGTKEISRAVGAQMPDYKDTGLGLGRFSPMSLIEQGLGKVFGEDAKNEFKGAFTPEGLSAAAGYAFADDPTELGRILEAQIPGAKLKTVAGQPMIEFQGETYFVNKPGASGADAYKMLAEIGLFAPAGAAAAAPRSMIGKMLAGGLLSSAVQAGKEGAVAALGGGNTFDDALMRTGLAGVGGAVGEGLGASAARLISKLGGKRLVDASGNFTDDATRMLRDLDYDPRVFTPEQRLNMDRLFGSMSRGQRNEMLKGGVSGAAARKSFAEQLAEKQLRRREAFNPDLSPGAAARAPVAIPRGERARTNAETLIAKATEDDFGIPLTRGQGSGNQAQLAQEEQLGFSGYLDPLRREQGEAIGQTVDALAGTGNKVDDAARLIADTTKNRDIYRQRMRDAYAAVKSAQDDAGMQLRFQKAAEQDLLERNAALLDRFPGIDGGTNPLAARGQKALDELTARFQRGDLPIEEIDRTRRILGDLQRDAASKIPPGAPKSTDVAFLTAAKEALDDWENEALLQALYTGDEALAGLYKDARSQAVAFHRVFGGKDAGSRLIQQIVADDANAAQIANLIMGASKIPAARKGINSLVDRLVTIGGQSGEAVQALRQGFAKTILRGSGTEPLSPGRMASSIKDALDGPPARLMGTLFSQEERSALRRLQYDMQRLARSTSRRSSGTAERSREAVRAAFKKYPALGQIMEAVDVSRARAAMAGPQLPAPDLTLGRTTGSALGAAAGTEYLREPEEGRLPAVPGLLDFISQTGR